ncbi:OmpA family protein [Caulobacter sp. S45]|uniref:OmpA family protein n=1 Tax=Caulobacter sp. S45 TaxID=1641861 RepID=UPI00131BF1DC|nr:OmpA family protein [Caulobacter sp. S45]
MSIRARDFNLVFGLGAAGLIGLAVAGCSTMEPARPAPKVASTCQDVTFPIYFAEDSDQLTGGAQQVLATAAAQVHGCHIGYVSVLGLTDAQGTPADNLDLSRRRAAVVAAALQGAGLPTPKFEIRALGEAGALTPGGKSVPLRRKTEVAIHASPA